MLIVIPMAGLSHRFQHEGFTIPKYMLYAGNRSLFNISVSSFSKYFETCSFLFIARDVFDTELFINIEAKNLGIKNFKVEILDKPTKGQAETVYIGLKRAGVDSSEGITIFNIDTFRKGFQFSSKAAFWDGYLEVFPGEGTKWSYARTENENSSKVVETTEKIPISPHCSTGLYYFRNFGLFEEAYNSDSCVDSSGSSKELYIAPMYNNLIDKGYDIHIDKIDFNEVEFCGVPEDYYSYLKRVICHKL
jgi:hypothetical protein